MKNPDNSTAKNTKQSDKTTMLNQEIKLWVVALLLLIGGFISGFFVNASRQDSLSGQTNANASHEKTGSGQTVDNTEEEPFEAAPIKQAPSNSVSPESSNPISVEIPDAVITTYTYEGVDKKPYTKSVIMAKLSVTNTSKQALAFDPYPLNLKDKDNEIMNVMFYGFLPNELSWYGGYFYTQSIPPEQTVIGLVTLELPADSHNETKAPLKLHLDKVNKTFELTPRRVENPNNIN